MLTVHPRLLGLDQWTSRPRRAGLGATRTVLSSVWRAVDTNPHFEPRLDMPEGGSPTNSGDPAGESQVAFPRPCHLRPGPIEERKVRPQQLLGRPQAGI